MRKARDEREQARKKRERVTGPSFANGIGEIPDGVLRHVPQETPQGGPASKCVGAKGKVVFSRWGDVGEWHSEGQSSDRRIFLTRDF